MQTVSEFLSPSTLTFIFNKIISPSYIGNRVPHVEQTPKFHWSVMVNYTIYWQFNCFDIKQSIAQTNKH